MTGSPQRLDRASAILLAKFVALTFLGFFDLGLPLGTLAPDVLAMGFGPAMVLTVIGIQSLVTIASRHRAGTFCDRAGARRTMLAGLSAATVAALLYLAVELRPVNAPAALVALLLAARILLGLAESLVLVGTLAGALVTLGPGRSWQVLALQGAAMHLGLILGVLAGMRIEDGLGPLAVPAAVVIVPLLAMALAAGIAVPDRPPSAARIAILDVLGRISQPGMILALATVPVAGSVLLLMPSVAAEHWRMPWPAFGALVLGYLCARAGAWRWRGRSVGASLLLLSLGAELCGQILLLTADGAALQLIGAFATGLGYSLVFPILGMAVLQRFPADLHGRAIGGYSAFQDLAIGIALPGAVLLLAWRDPGHVFGVGVLATAGAWVLALSYTRRDLTIAIGGGTG
ncbi:hypothetical protein [Enterovirga rhinocerotis]|uniref:Putative MFS family arabinose efflux permease n=1 Tax=Enterovirga rhinocerotis TaxID=1339210 RepID=A0A4R7C435_9HYPH|nr:hypothetical protein [Enterovirga rhinocerotis]TDR92901.1 putative MFS family arabinose efflux permease [Enterovirga rhinocerotis]